MILSKLRSLSFVMAVVISITVLGVFTVQKTIAATEETIPGYRLVNVYDAQSGVVTSKIYVTDGKAMVGMLGLKYDTELVSLVAKSNDGTLTTEYEDLVAKGKISAFISGGSGVNVIDGTNNLSDLINEEKGEFFFEWYYGMGAAVLDARENDVGLAVIRFKVNDGVTKEELEKSGKAIVAFAAETPSDPNVTGYGSGVYCANENNLAVRNNPNARKRITLYTEYQGLDISGGFDIRINENENGIAIPATYGTTKRIMTLPLNTQSSEIRSVLTLPLNMAAVIQTRDGEVSPEIVKTGDTITLTKGNIKETIVIAAKSDTDGDGNVTMADLNTLMRVISGNLENAPEEALYTVDTNGDRVLSDEEYEEFIADIIESNK